MRSVAIAGSGRLARALALALRRSAEMRFVGIHGRRPAAVADLLAEAGVGRALDLIDLQQADTVFFAVSDAAVAVVASALDAALEGKVGPSLWLHGAGALGLDPFAGVRRAGRRFAVLHPLASLPASATAPLEGCRFVATGDRSAAGDVGALAAALGGVVQWIDDLDSVLYHAACTLLANGATALAAAGADLLARASAGRLGRLDAAALIASALRPLDSGAPADSLTGPVRRGDTAVIAAHRAALATSPGVLAIYDALMARALDLVRRELDPETAQRIEDLVGRRGGSQP